MGKSGALLREQKKKTTTYVFTREQLEAHDHLVIKNHLEGLRLKVAEEQQKRYDESMKQFNVETEKIWRRNQQLFGGKDISDNFYNAVAYVTAISIRVLCEQFNWAPIPLKGIPSKRLKLVRFVTAFQDALEEISDDSHLGIQTYCEETYEKYGVKFSTTEE